MKTLLLTLVLSFVGPATLSSGETTSLDLKPVSHIETVLPAVTTVTETNSDPQVEVLPTISLYLILMTLVVIFIYSTTVSRAFVRLAHQVTASMVFGFVIIACRTVGDLKYAEFMFAVLTFVVWWHFPEIGKTRNSKIVNLVLALSLFYFSYSMWTIDANRMPGEQLWFIHIILPILTLVTVALFVRRLLWRILSSFFVRSGS